MRAIYQVQIGIIIYQLLGGFSAKFVSSRISQNIFFYMIGNKSFHFIFWNGAFPKLVFTFKEGEYLKIRSSNVDEFEIANFPRLQM